MSAGVETQTRSSTYDARPAHAPRPGRVWARMRRRWLLVLLLAAITAWVLAPYFFLVVASVAQQGTMISGFSIPRFLTWANFKAVLEGANIIWPSLVHSAIVSVGATLVAIIFAVPAAYGLSKLRTLPVARNLYLSFFVFRGVPPVALVIPYFVIFSHTHLLNSFLGLILASVSLSLPFAVWTLRVFFDAIPPELEEAASIEGANVVQRFVYVVVPLVGSGIAATAVLAMLLVYVDFIFAGTLSGADTATFAVYVTGFQLDQLTLSGQLAAASIIGTIPMVIMYAFSQRYMSRMAIAGIH